MNKVTVKEVEAMSDEFFECLIPLKNTVGSKAKTSIHYVYYIFECSPSADDIRLLKSLKKRKILKATSSVPVIIDLEKQLIHARPGSYPSKKILQKCFIQAGGFDDAVRNEAHFDDDEDNHSGDTHSN